MKKHLLLYFILAVACMVVSEYYLLLELYHLQRTFRVIAFAAGVVLGAGSIFYCFKRFHSNGNQA
ncbi:MAG TPA: hypothetical protein VHK69_16695 [Chitinophagaceae bacterium]|nr:hypothetical protein [Chitinophagaceae bacterium]